MLNNYNYSFYIIILKVMGIASSVLKIEAVSCQWVKDVFSEEARENIDFHKKTRGKFILFG